MPSEWNAMPYQPPWRVMIIGTGTAKFFDASDGDRAEVFFPRFAQMLSEWEELGARAVSSFCDDVFQVGEVEAPAAAWYLIFEIDRLEIAAQMMQASRQTVGGVRLDTWIRLQLRLGRPFFAREETTPHHLVDPESSAYSPA